MKSGFHSLIRRFAAYLGALLLVAMAALFLIDHFVFTPSLLREEAVLAHKELVRIEATLNQNRSALMAHTRDWAHWDDTYQFIQGQHTSYADANFSQQMFEDLNTQLMVFLDAEGDTAFVSGIDPATDAYSVCTRATGPCQWAAPIVESVHQFLAEVPDSGLSLNPALPWASLAAISPILRTDRQGPRNGWLITIRLIDARLMGLLEEQTGLPLQIVARQTENSPKQPMKLERSDEFLTAAHYFESDTPGYELVLNTRIPRERFEAGTETFRYALGWTAALLITVIGLVLLLLVSVVLRPLTQFIGFASHQHTFESANNFGELTGVPPALLIRKDEFGKLARHFQRMIKRQNNQAKTLKALSMQDPLTTLPNRRKYDTTLEKHLTEDRGKELSAMMVDIDHFKHYNDQYGHQAGDECLVRVAEGMQRSLAGTGFLIARTGGEEFSVLMPNTPLDLGTRYAEQLRKTVEDLYLRHEASSTADMVTLSIGVTSTHEAETHSATELMRSADKALYEAKANGRNRVSCYRKAEAEV